MISVRQGNWSPFLGAPKEAGGAAQDCAEESSTDRAPELVQSSCFTVLAICSLPDAYKRANEESDGKTSSGMSVLSGADLHFGDLLPTERSRGGASGEPIVEAVGPGRTDRNESESGVRP